MCTHAHHNIAHIFLSFKSSEGRCSNIKNRFYLKYIFLEIVSFTGQIHGIDHSQ
jgi:hypothetical protein